MCSPEFSIGQEVQKVNGRQLIEEKMDLLKVRTDLLNKKVKVLENFMFTSKKLKAKDVRKTRDNLRELNLELEKNRNELVQVEKQMARREE